MPCWVSLCSTQPTYISGLNSCSKYPSTLETTVRPEPFGFAQESLVEGLTANVESHPCTRIRNAYLATNHSSLTGDVTPPPSADANAFPAP